MDIKDVIKNLINTKLIDELKKEFHPEGLMINVFFSMNDEVEMMNKLERVAPELMIERNKQRRKFRSEVISRSYFDKFFVPKNINLKKFREEIAVPPEISSINPLKFDRISFTGPTVFVAGRYNKFSRELSQTPWILEGKRVSEGSVQEIIVEVIAPHFNVPVSNVTFMASGREDVDVRCLGRGRPFILEIMDAKKFNLSHVEATMMEEKLRGSKLVSIRDIQMVER
jgi:tRNA pseudouridine synthase 10